MTRFVVILAILGMTSCVDREAERQRLLAERQTELAACNAQPEPDRCACLEMAATKWESGVSVIREKPITRAAKSCRSRQTNVSQKILNGVKTLMER